MYDPKNTIEKISSTKLLDVEQFICIGEYTVKVQQAPKLPPGASEKLLICYPKEFKNLKNIMWLIFKDETELK